MAKRMKLWVIGALLLGVAGNVMASNMGFKFVPNMTDPGSVLNYTRGVSLPLNNNYTNADSVTADILTTCGASGPQLIRVNPSVGGTSTTFWTPGGAPGASNFPIVKGAGYKVSINAACTSWVVVGSHDPAYVYSFPVVGNSYLASVPYHTTATVANDLIVSVPSGETLTRINASAGGTSTTFWKVGGAAGASNFSVAIGEAYLVTVTNPSSWTPAHY